MINGEKKYLVHVLLGVVTVKTTTMQLMTSI